MQEGDNGAARRWLALAGCAMGMTAASPALADESPFAAVYMTDVLPKGSMEVEQWLTWEHKRPFQSYDHLAGRTEFEMGVAKDFQLALYANYDYRRIRPFDPADADESTNSLDFTSVSAEAVYQVTDPYTHPIGFALYVEPSIGADVRELEAKLLFDSYFLDDRLVLAVNLALEYEWEREGGEWHKGSEVTLLAGLAYRIAPRWHAGLEFKASREIDGLTLLQKAEAAADSFFVGPTLHYAERKWWATLGAQAQLPWAKNLSGAPGETVDGYAHEEPRYSLRLRIGVPL